MVPKHIQNEDTVRDLSEMKIQLLSNCRRYRQRWKKYEAEAQELSKISQYTEYSALENAHLYRHWYEQSWNEYRHIKEISDNLKSSYKSKFKQVR